MISQITVGSMTGNSVTVPRSTSNTDRLTLSDNGRSAGGLSFGDTTSISSQNDNWAFSAGKCDGKAWFNNVCVLVPVKVTMTTNAGAVAQTP